MHNYLKNKSAWLQLVIFGGLTFGITFAGSFLGLSIVAALNHINLNDLTNFKPDDYAKPQYAGLVRGLLVVQFFAIFLLPSLVFAYLADPRPLQFAGFKKPDRSSFILLGIIIVFCSYLMVAYLGVLNEKFVHHFLGKSAQQWVEKAESDATGTMQNILTMNNTKDLLVSIFLVGVLAAIGEELFFRGILQRIFIQVFKNPWWGIVVTAAIFSAVHGQFLGFIPRMILGIVLGALYWYSGSLWTSIIGHFIFNTLQIILVYVKAADVSQQNDGNDKFLPGVSIIAGIVVIALLNYLRKRSLTTYSQVYRTEINDGFLE
ncbi:MAG TPA: CPBP family intramembrane glutamic endopeptidase [Puia sp.]|nr:CPBP family intramembrane glutamic endopeptidase [Puia sp.]